VGREGRDLRRRASGAAAYRTRSPRRSRSDGFPEGFSHGPSDGFDSSSNLARERGGPYVADVAAAIASSDRPPVVDQTPGLAALLDLVGLADRAVALAIEQLIELRASGEIEAATGVTVELWLQQVARRTSCDVRMLLAASELLPRLPATRDAFLAGELSWSQVRAVVLACRRLRTSALDEADTRVRQWLWSASDAAPDTVSRGLARLAWELDEEREKRCLDDDEARQQRDEFVALQPRLDGSGGRFFGEAGAANFALLDAALNDGLEVPAGRGDFLDPGDRPAQSRAAGSQRATRLFGWAADHLDQVADKAARGDALAPASSPTAEGTPEPSERTSSGPAPRPGSARRGSIAGRVGLLLRLELSTLLGGGLPADLLTTMTGGHLRLSGSAARRLADAGVELRTVIVDECGAVVGIGRASRQSPGWLHDAALALNASCTGPCCAASARVSHLDHAQPWHPVRPDDLPGTTDIANMAPLCGRQNRTKERDGWKVTGSADGGRVWTHPRSGIVYRHLPDHWRPPDPPGRHTREGDPPGIPSPGDPPPGQPAPDNAQRGRARVDRPPDDDPIIDTLLDPRDPTIPF
jgi:hypothetical protein